MALVYEHRAWDTINLTFVYWQAPSYDPTGAFWPGPPPFGDLTDVLVQRVFDDGQDGASAQPPDATVTLDPPVIGGLVDVTPFVPFPAAAVDLGAPVAAPP